MILLVPVPAWWSLIYKAPPINLPFWKTTGPALDRLRVSTDYRKQNYDVPFACWMWCWLLWLKMNASVRIGKSFVWYWHVPMCRIGVSYARQKKYVRSWWRAFVQGRRRTDWAGRTISGEEGFLFFMVPYCVCYLYSPPSGRRRIEILPTFSQPHRKLRWIRSLTTNGERWQMKARFFARKWLCLFYYYLFIFILEVCDA